MLTSPNYLFRFCPGGITFEYIKLLIKKHHQSGNLQKIHAFKKQPVFQKLFQNLIFLCNYPRGPVIQKILSLHGKKNPFRYRFSISTFTLIFSKEWYFSSVEKLCTLTILFFTILLGKAYLAYASPFESAAKLNFSPFQVLWSLFL